MTIGTYGKINVSLCLTPISLPNTPHKSGHKQRKNRLQKQRKNRLQKQRKNRVQTLSVVIGRRFGALRVTGDG
jgi:hypothetical protein